MAKLKSSFTKNNTQKPPVVGGLSSTSGGLTNIPAPKDLAAKIVSPASAGSLSQALNFGHLHTKAVPSSNSSGSQWSNLLSTATGLSSVLSGGVASAGGFGFIGKLISLFGGGKSTPTVPVAFQSPVPQQDSLNITLPGATSAVTLGVHTGGVAGLAPGIYQHTGTTISDSQLQSTQVVQIVKQALLTSSTLNDVISEI